MAKKNMVKKVLEERKNGSTPGKSVMRLKRRVHGKSKRAAR